MTRTRTLATVTGVILGGGLIIGLTFPLIDGTDYDTFRTTYVDRATYGNPTQQPPPPALTDHLIDLALDQVCQHDQPNTDQADLFAVALTNPDYGPSTLGSAILAATKATGCD